MLKQVLELLTLPGLTKSTAAFATSSFAAELPTAFDLAKAFAINFTSAAAFASSALASSAFASSALANSALALEHWCNLATAIITEDSFIDSAVGSAVD